MAGLLARLTDWVSNNPTIVNFIHGNRWLHRTVNALAIDSTVKHARPRPHPWTTIHDYTSWDALTQTRWSARHLPPEPPRQQRSAPSELAEFFRTEGEQALSSKSTCLFPAFAQHLTDGFIRTRMPHGDEPVEVRLQNTSNHNIDLSPLYGRTMEQTTLLRLRSEDPGRKGRLRTQLIDEEEFAPFLYDADGEFADPEFAKLDAPLGLHNVRDDPPRRSSLFAFGGDRANAAPQVAAINTLFLREHNRLAGVLERDHPAWDDERVFQTARNVVIVLYIKLVVEEYINHISPARVRFLADPKVAWKARWNRPNWITTEFSLLYRWHSLVPATVRWGDVSYATGETILNNQPLVAIGLTQACLDMSAQAAGELGAFNTAPSLVPIEQQAIEQNRLARLPPYNRYREHVELRPAVRFEDISSNPRVVEFLRARYNSVEDVEFYVGLFAEDRKANSPLPDLLTRMVAIDAFSQALTNPLLSETVYKPATFADAGWQTIQTTATLADVLARNVRGSVDGFVGMTQPDWEPV